MSSEADPEREALHAEFDEWFERTQGFYPHRSTEPGEHSVGRDKGLPFTDDYEHPYANGAWHTFREFAIARGTTARASLSTELEFAAQVLEKEADDLRVCQFPKREAKFRRALAAVRAALSPQPAPPNSAQGHQTASDSESPEAVGDGCRKCGGEMRPGKAIFSTWGGSPDFIGDAVVVTMSPSGPGRLVDCLKCARCGWSVTTTASGLSANSRSDSKDGGGDHHE